MSLKDKYKKRKNITQENIGDIYKEYLQSYLAWLSLQNPKFHESLADEELINYLFHEINIPSYINAYIDSNPLQILSKTYEYISRYKDKTSIFTISNEILPKKKGPYKKYEVCS